MQMKGKILICKGRIRRYKRRILMCKWRIFMYKEVCAVLSLISTSPEAKNRSHDIEQMKSTIVQTLGAIPGRAIRARATR